MSDEIKPRDILLRRAPTFFPISITRVEDAQLPPGDHAWNGKPEQVSEHLASQRCSNCGELAVNAAAKCKGRTE